MRFKYTRSKHKKESCNAPETRRAPHAQSQHPEATALGSKLAPKW